MKEGISNRLKEYSGSDFYPFHMPGHKGNLKDGVLAEVYQYDITEIDGFDNLHQPRSLLKDAQVRAAELYHSEETYYLVNGSTGGILSAVSAVAGRGDKLIIARNCHKAVYHAAFLNRMELYYVYPEIIKEYGMAGQVRAQELEDVICSASREKGGGGIAAVVITSPTYEGIVSHVGELAKTAHKYGIPLIVDQAHGAHFGIHPAYPKSAVEEGADVVIHSVHKTMPAPTQTALLHRNGTLVSKDILRKYLGIYQTSSPSYLLMAGIDDGVAFAAREGYGSLDRLLSMRKDFLEGLAGCAHIRVCPLTEPGKLVAGAWDCSITGQALYDVLRENYHLQMEMASGCYVVAILTMRDKWEGMERLRDALLEIDKSLSGDKADSSFMEGRPAFRKARLPVIGKDYRPEVNLSLWQAYLALNVERSLEEAVGWTAASFVYLYPPGIPLLAPGEEVGAEMVELIIAYINNGYNLLGVQDKKIKVVKKGEENEKDKDYLYHRACK